jgi:hypothetical protein
MDKKNSQSLVVELQRLAELRQQGMLTEEEFHDSKKKLLSSGKTPHPKQLLPKSASNGNENRIIKIIGIGTLIALLAIGITYKTLSKEEIYPSQQTKPNNENAIQNKQDALTSENYNDVVKSIRVYLENRDLLDMPEPFGAWLLAKALPFQYSMPPNPGKKVGPNSTLLSVEKGIIDNDGTLENSEIIEFTISLNNKDTKIIWAGPIHSRNNKLIIDTTDYSEIPYQQLINEWKNKYCFQANATKENWIGCTHSKSENEIKINSKTAIYNNTESSELSINSPNINIGDRYTYETEATDSNGKVTTSTSIREVTAIDGDRVTVTATGGKSGKVRTLIYDRSWNIVETGTSPNLGVIYSPAIKYFDFPLTVGKKWTNTSTETDKKTGKTRQHIVNGEVIGWDNYLTGTYQGKKLDALKIRLETEVLDGEKKSTGIDTSWYIPAIGRTGKSEIQGEDAEGRKEKKSTKVTDIHLQNGWKQ